MPRNPRNSCQPPNDQRRPSRAPRTARTHTTSANDLFYGRRTIAETCSKFLVAAYDAPLFASGSYLDRFIAHALHRTKSADPVAHGALILLERLEEISRGRLDSNPGGQRELFIAALKIASESFEVLRSNNELRAIELFFLQVDESNETESVLRSVLLAHASTTRISHSDLDAFLIQLMDDPTFNRFRTREVVQIDTVT